MSKGIPVGIVAALEELGARLVEISREHADARLGELEQAVLEQVRRVMPRLLEEVVVEASRPLRLAKAGIRAACPGCGKRVGVHSWRGRRVLTVCGKLSLERPYYRCSRCGRGFSWVDEQLGLGRNGRLSAGVEEWLVELGASSASFRDAAAVLARLTGLEVSAETVRARTEGRGRLLEEAEQAAAVRLADPHAADEGVERAPGVLVTQTDGVMVRYLDGWHEVKLGVVGGQLAGELVEPSFVAARASGEEFGPRLMSEAARRGALEVVGWQGPLMGRGLAKLREVVMLGDGAHWIWSLAAEHFGERTEIVDFYHVCEHIWLVAHALYGEGSERAANWANQQISTLLEQGPAPLLRALRRAKAPGAQAAQVLRREQGYFHYNRTRLDYPTFRQRGLPIASGAVESAGKYLVQDRLKRPGARWSTPGAHTALAVRCRLLSHRSIAA